MYLVEKESKTKNSKESNKDKKHYALKVLRKENFKNTASDISMIKNEITVHRSLS